MTKKHQLDMSDEEWKQVRLYQIVFGDNHDHKNVNDAVLELIKRGLKEK